MRSNAVLAFLVGSLCSGVASAQSSGKVPAIAPLSSQAPKTLPLTDNEQRAVQVTRTLQSQRLTPARGVDGSVRYVFGEATPVVVCAPLRVCDLALQPGEKVDRVIVGDNIRWSIAPALSGTGTSQRTHAAIKPLDVGLSTNLMITTDRRVYHVTLKSAQTDHMPSITFEYPEDSQSAWAALAASQSAADAATSANATHQERKVIPGVGLKVDDLNFDYRIVGSFEWAPTRVFSDGLKTYIELPPEAVAREVPIPLFPNAGKEEIVNYSLDKNRYTIDALVDDIVLVRGVGWRQERIQITAGRRYAKDSNNPHSISN